jgi:hypothetical protein
MTPVRGFRLPRWRDFPPLRAFHPLYEMGVPIRGRCKGSKGRFQA